MLRANLPASRRLHCLVHVSRQQNKDKPCLLNLSSDIQLFHSATSSKWNEKNQFHSTDEPDNVNALQYKTYSPLSNSCLQTFTMLLSWQNFTLESIINKTKTVWLMLTKQNTNVFRRGFRDCFQALQC